MLYYSIAHYYDVSSHRRRNKYRNIENHINAFLNLDMLDKHFILVSAIDTLRGDIRYDEIKEDLENFCKQFIPINQFSVIVKFNWGGTIAALWETYILLKNINARVGGFVAHFEEDFGPQNTNWYNKSIELLTGDKIYIGESNIGRIKYENDDGRLTGAMHLTQPHLGNPEVWSDGGFYFSTIENFIKIEEKIGIFHKGNPYNKYNNALDGISLGEVGFPTLLHHAGFKFDVLNRSSYFVNEWND